MAALNTARWYQAHPATAISRMAAGKNGAPDTDISSGNDPAKRDVRTIATANSAGNRAASGDHRSQRGVVNCFLRFIFLRNIFILLIVVSSLLVSTTDAVISSRGDFPNDSPTRNRRSAIHTPIREAFGVANVSSAE
ncbi:uncharacterized protein LOC101253008 [Anopheles sinensis]|uniref:Uncharacterized protein LOC101253008 n=1 Tax=Anopheles sinensis TaxID=74873 RepID=A0A084VNT4_ANOSI|nr:uncharacterized protein LOC101253008 [Anopheles sinensis]